MESRWDKSAVGSSALPSRFRGRPLESRRPSLVNLHTQESEGIHRGGRCVAGRFLQSSKCLATEGGWCVERFTLVTIKRHVPAAVHVGMKLRNPCAPRHTLVRNVTSDRRPLPQRFA